MKRLHGCVALAAVLAAGLALAVSAPVSAQNNDQDTFTPMPLDAGFGRMDVSAPKIPAEQIIKKFAARETEFRDALNNYTYRRVAKVETVDDDTNKPDGEWYEVDDVIFDPSGKRVEKVVYAPGSTLTRVQMSESDFQDIEHGYPFVLTTDKLPEYDIKYVGRQRIDEVDCYAFDVAPKEIQKGERYLDGRIWVDATDLQIVVVDGRMVPDDTRKGHEDLHPPFMTWRQQVDGKYWFPVYTKAEGVLHFSGGNGYMSQDVHIRDIIKYTDYKQYGSTSKIIFAGKDITPPAGSVPSQPGQPGAGPVPAQGQAGTAPQSQQPKQ
ncbi:MAG TPA: hypothetical protein VGR64_08340 [Terracidiphilus sp.]|nr:hypothetical protein [Terracidiphilus sp.]